MADFETFAVETCSFVGAAFAGSSFGFVTFAAEPFAAARSSVCSPAAEFGFAAAAAAG